MPKGKVSRRRTGFKSSGEGSRSRQGSSPTTRSPVSAPRRRTNSVPTRIARWASSALCSSNSSLQ
eukprot:10677707-Alexandrium_andersonii.AAC.1